MRTPFALLILSIACSAALAQDSPRRKSGLWEVSMSSAQMPQAMVTRQCVDEKTDDFGKGGPRGKEKCSKQSVRREGGNVIVESVCQIEGSTATSRGVFSGDFASSYKGELHTKFAPPLHGNAESKMSFQGRHLGPCPAGQKPGQATMQNMPGGAGGMDAEQARRMAEEMMKKHQK